MLELTADHRRRGPSGYEGSEVRRAPAPVGPVERFGDRLEVEKAEDLGFVERSVEGSRVQYVGEIDERPCRGGDWEAFEGRAVRCGEAADTVDVDAAGARRAAGGGRHLVARAVGPAQTPGCGSAAVAERRAGSAGEHRRPPVPARPEPPVAQGVDAVVDREEPPGADAVLDRADAEPA